MSSAGTYFQQGDMEFDLSGGYNYIRIEDEDANLFLIETGALVLRHR